MTSFDPGWGYAPDRDVRLDHWRAWAQRLREGDRPNGAFWVFVGPRRSGKTWALTAIERLLDCPGQVVRIELSGLASADELLDRQERWLLLDEPGGLIKEASTSLGTTCATLKERGQTIIVAMSPGEYALMYASAPPAIHRTLEFQAIPPLRDPDVARMARGVAWAETLLARLPTGWTASPFLIELLLSTATPADVPKALDIEELCHSTLKRACTGLYDYVEQVFEEGLSDSQRVVLRKIAHGVAPKDLERFSLEVLTRCGLIRDGRIADPALAKHLPPPFIIHHVSDVHVGQHSARTVDLKSSDIPPPPDLTVRAAYLSHIRHQGPDAPHMVVVSGDVLEFGKDDEYRDGVAWMTELDGIVSSRLHPDLACDVGRVLIAPGNHDVDRSAAQGPDGERRRHARFAAAFAKWPRALLEEAPESRGLSVVDLGDALDIEIVLLGSSEYGQQHIRDKTSDRLGKLTEELWTELNQLTRPEHWAEYQKLRSTLDIIDPAMVHPRDLERLSGRRACDRIRIVALHHPVSPVPANPEISRYAGLLNAGAVRQALFQSKTALVLHGHQHTGWFGQERWPARYEGQTLTIASAPSLGSSQAAEENGFNEIRVVREGRTVSISIRRFTRQGNQWAPRTESIPVPLQLQT